MVWLGRVHYWQITLTGEAGWVLVGRKVDEGNQCRSLTVGWFGARESFSRENWSLVAMGELAHNNEAKNGRQQKHKSRKDREGVCQYGTSHTHDN